MSVDFKPIVKETYLHIIKGTLDKILLFQTDVILNELVRLHMAEPPKADEVLIVTDKFFIYKKLWQGILETLYETYLPYIQYEFNWEIEITPYSLMLCELTKEYFSSTEIESFKKILAITDEQIEKDYNSILEKIGVESLGLKEGLQNKIPNTLLPKTKKEELILLFRIMNFPPLSELALFLERYNQNLKTQVENLSIAFSGIDVAKIPNFGTGEHLHYSYFHLDHNTFKKYGFDTFEKHPELKEYKSDFVKIRNIASQNVGNFKDSCMCPCCGKTTEIVLPEEILQYKLLLENQTLCKRIGLLYLKDYIENYKTNFSEKFHSFFPNINKVDNPDCLILVEGESEEISIPILAFRIRFILSMHNVQVYNSKSKQKLAADFLSFKEKYPNRKMICLLDSDAVKERDSIQRIIKDKKDKYRIVFIEQGTFEDIFPIDDSIAILNKLYPDGELIVKSDFEPSKDFLTNVNRVLHFKKKAEFDKVSFAQKISLQMDIEKLPKEINEIFETVKLFTKPTKYLKR